MSLKFLTRSRKYVNKINLWIAVGMIVILMVFSSISFVYVSNSMMENRNIADRKTLNQIKYNIDYMNEVMKAICFNIYYNRDVRALVNDDNLDFGEIQRQIIELKTSVVNTILNIQSVYIYNRESKKYYTTQDEMMFEDRSLDELIRSYREVPKLTPLYRRIYINNAKGIYLDVVSYFLYEYKDQFGKPDGAVIVNYKLDWLMNNIKTLNMTAELDDRIYIMDQNGKFLGADEDGGVTSALAAVYKEYRIKNPEQPAGNFRETLNNVDHMVSYAYVENTQWVLFKVQPVSQIFQKTDEIRNALFLLIIAFVVLSLIVSRTAAKSIYKPIGKLISQIKNNDPDMKVVKQQGDEIAYLNDFYHLSLKSMERYDRERNSNSSILKEHFLLKLLKDSYSIEREEWEKASEELSLSLAKGTKFIVCMLMVDDYRNYVLTNSREDRVLNEFMSADVVSGLLSERFSFEVLDQKDGRIVFILSDTGMAGDPSGSIADCIRKAQEIFADHFSLQFSAAVSSDADSYRDISRLYNEAVINSMYRVVYGRRSILTPDLVRANIENRRQGYDPSWENKVTQDIMVGNMKSFETTITAVFEEIAQLNYHHILLAVMSLINTLKTSVDKLNAVRTEPVFVDTEFLTGDVLEMDTLDDLKARILEVVGSIISKTERIGNERYIVLTQSIKDIIDANYSDNGLYLPLIASRLNLSVKHIARVFKSVTQTSINAYINDVRMKKAVEWLENSKLSIHDIQLRVGIDNESYFYKLFKAKYGITPREYMMNIANKEDKSKI